jgi:hypothetical protein
MFIRFCFGSWGWGSEYVEIFTENVPGFPGVPSTLQRAPRMGQSETRMGSGRIMKERANRCFNSYRIYESPRENKRKLPGPSRTGNTSKIYSVARP